VVLAVLVCLRLGWWQWDRTHESTGTAQNLGYAVLWPIFGAAFVYMWIRFLQLEVLKDGEDEAELTELAAGGEGAESSRPMRTPVPLAEPSEVDSRPTEVASDSPADATRADGSITDRAVGDTSDTALIDSRRAPSRGYPVAVSTVGGETEEEDPELAAYNRALAALAEKDKRRAR
jgi:hypothetical protein